MFFRVDPFRELDRVIEPAMGPRRPALLAMDATRAADAVEVRFDVPGVDPDAIEVTVERNELTVSAEREASIPEGATVLVAERPVGRVTRQVQLGQGLDAERLEASYEHGVLLLRIPVAEQAKPRKVQVAVGEGARGIEANARDADPSQS